MIIFQGIVLFVALFSIITYVNLWLADFKSNIEYSNEEANTKAKLKLIMTVLISITLTILYLI